MKICIRCHQEKDILDFNFKFKSRNIRQAQCKICTRLYVRNHYYTNKKYYLLKAHKRRQATRNRIREFIWNYLSSHGCIDCGEKDILVLEFDHRRDKMIEIGKMVSGYYSLIRVNQEISKCDVRCANCHRRRTAIEQGWHKSKFAPVG